MAKILLYDLETGPNLGYVWGKWEQNVTAFKQEWGLLSFAYKWLDDKTITVIGRNTKSEAQLVKELHKLFDEADVVIAHNGDQFDQKMANAKFIQFNLDPPSSYKSIDTKKVAKRYFRFNSNKLDDLGNILGLGRKLETGGFDLWLGCLDNDPKSWAKMLKYNKQDVVLLEKVYLKLRPWIDNHPSVSILDDILNGCPKCGSTKLIKRGMRLNKTSVVQRYKCQGCGGWCQSRKTQAVDNLYTN